MNNDSTPPGRSSPKRIRQLAASKADETSERGKDILSEMKDLARRPPSQWIARRKEIYNESVVFVLRRAGPNDRKLYTELVQELFRRTRRIANRVLRRWSIDRFDQIDIVATVSVQILELVFEKQSTPTGRFLEVAFNTTVEQHTLKVIRKHVSTPFGHRGEFLPFNDGQDVDEGEEIERPIELAPDTRPSPEANCIENERRKRIIALYNKALAAIKGRLCRKVIQLHICDGLPISSKDPAVKTVASVLKNVTVGRIKHLVEDGKRMIRAALMREVQHD